MKKYEHALYRIRGLILQNGQIVEKFAPKSINILQNLVNKAMPKKVVYKKGSDGKRWFFCPNCNEIVPRTSNYIDQYKYPFCPYCGQNMDWSDY